MIFGFRSLEEATIFAAIAWNVWKRCNTKVFNSADLPPPLSSETVLKILGFGLIDVKKVPLVLPYSLGVIIMIPLELSCCLSMLSLQCSSDMLLPFSC
jgi:hypothetical protein